MKKIECYIVQDLLPLYIDHTCSKQTTEDMEGHLQSCESCKKLYEEMNSNICSVLPTPEIDSRKVFLHAMKSVLAIILALAAFISSTLINASGSWMGDRANISNLIVTILYVFSWCVFSIQSRRYIPLIKVTFAISCITFITSTAGLVCRSIHVGGFITAIIIGTFSAVPFYGLTYFMDWTGLYATAMVISLAWLIYASYFKHKLENTSV